MPYSGLAFWSLQKRPLRSISQPPAESIHLRDTSFLTRRAFRQRTANLLCRYIVTIFMFTKLVNIELGYPHRNLCALLHFY